MHRLDLFPNNDLISQYRQTFSSKNGADVLVHMLFDLGIFQESSLPEDIAIRNYGLRLLKILGGGEPNEQTIDQLTKKLMRQILPKETPDE